jgi:flagellar biosynthesis protein FlhB
MAEQGQTGEKTEDATPKRKQDARKKGQAAKSQDLVSAFTLLVAAYLIPWLCQSLGDALRKVIVGMGSQMPEGISSEEVIRFTGSVTAPLAVPVLILFCVLAVTGVGACLGQVGLLWSSQPLKPEFRKINPLEGAKRMFSKRSLFEGIKAILKMAIFGLIAYDAVSGDWPKLVGLAGLPAAQALGVIGALVQTVMVRIAAVWLAIAALDYFFQRMEHDKQLKMTKTELKNEMKEQEGSPEVKMARMQQRRRMAKGSLKSRLAEADVVVTNPTHFAVALSYSRSTMAAPIVVAKGQDYLALKIRELATEQKIPLVENRPLARALYRDCEVGDPIPRDLFTPVAEVLAYVYKTFGKVREKKKAASVR